MNEAKVEALCAKTLDRCPTPKECLGENVCRKWDHGPGEYIARRFHDTYERLAPCYGYVTRPETREFDPKSPNGRLMIAVVESLIHADVIAQGDEYR